MASELTVWVTPFTDLGSLAEAIGTVQAMTPDGWHGNLLLPTHFGPWPQSQCNQTLPDDMRVAGPEDIEPIRSAVEGAGLGFGAWGVPYDGSFKAATLAADFAKASGYYAHNVERGVFWTPGLNRQAVQDYVGAFWNAGDMDALDGNVTVTVVPSTWEITDYYATRPSVLVEWCDGASMMLMETYGGPATRQWYPRHSPACFPDLWPDHSTCSVQRLIGSDYPVACILARENLDAQLAEAEAIGGSAGVHVWTI